MSNLSVYQGTVREMNLSYAYDAAGQLVRDENGLTDVIATYQYMPMGQLKSQMSYSGGDMIAPAWGWRKPFPPAAP